MNRRRVLLALASCLAACAGSKSEPDAAIPGAAPSPAAAATGAAGAGARPAAPFRAALLSPGPISDAGWNAAAYAGLKKIESDLGATVAQLETRTPSEFEEGFREFASSGFDLVFGHGFEFQDAAAKVGAEFPRTTFITTSGSTVRDNVAAMVFRLEEATYLLGMLAAEMAPPGGSAGVVGGVKIPSVGSTFLAFTAGVHAVRPDMPVLEAWIGSWEDVSAAKEATLAQVRQGARFIFHNADAAGIGALRAVEEATRPDQPVWAFGSNQDQSAVAPEVVLASAVLDIPGAFVAVAREVRDGSFKPRVIELGMREGVVSLVYNPQLAAAVPAQARAKVEAARQEILAGTRAVPKGF